MAERKDGLPRCGWTKAGREPIKRPELLDIAWAAGIWEGEGSVFGQGRGKSSIQVMVTQKDPWLLYRLKDYFGGNVYHLKSQVCGRWEISGPRARGFIMTIFTFLSPRRRVQVKRAFGLGR